MTPLEKRRPAALVEQLNLALFSRSTHYRFLNNINAPNDDEVERAVRFYYLIKTSFGSTCLSGWGYSKTNKSKSLVSLDIFNQVRSRLEGIYIENRSFEKVIAAYDSKETLSYLDPP